MFDCYWQKGDEQIHVVVTSYYGLGNNGNQYVNTETGDLVPIDELHVIDGNSPYVGLWVDTTE